MPLLNIPAGENPRDYDGFQIYTVEFAGRHGRRETEASVRAIAEGLGLNFKIVYQGDGVFYFQVKGRADKLLTFEREFDILLEKYGRD